jgi:hypothetical protein
MLFRVVEPMAGRVANNRFTELVGFDPHDFLDPLEPEVL